MKKTMILFVCLIGMLLLAGCGSGSNPNGSAEDLSYDTVPTYEIQTDYAVLKYTEQWKDAVTTEIQAETPYTVHFSANGAALFDLMFNADQGDVLGTLTTEAGQYLLTVQMAELDQNAVNYQDLAAMQEDINVITAHLKQDYQFVSGVDVREEDPELYEIKTPVANLYYPVKWQDKVTVEVLDNGAKFSCGDTPLFDVLFGEGDGIVAGTYDGMDVIIVDYPVEDEEMANMQEDVNVILEHLQESE